jgi:hypothetical protein
MAALLSGRSPNEAPFSRATRIGVAKAIARSVDRLKQVDCGKQLSKLANQEGSLSLIYCK